MLLLFSEDVDTWNESFSFHHRLSTFIRTLLFAGTKFSKISDLPNFG